MDLYVFVDAPAIPGRVESHSVHNLVRVRNLGPDPATGVYADLGQVPAIAPGLRLTNPGGAAGVSCSGTRCTIASMAAGSFVDLQVEPRLTYSWSRVNCAADACG